MLNVYCMHVHATSSYSYHAHLYLAAIMINYNTRNAMCYRKVEFILRVLPDPDSSNVKVNLCT